MLHKFDRVPLTANGQSFDVFVTRTGDAPIVLLHELPGLSPDTLRLAFRLESHGFRVYMPLLFGEAGEKLGPLKMLAVGVGSRTKPFAREQLSPRIGLARATIHEIARRGASKHRCGVIGMCMTGSWGIALLPEPAVGAAVLSQPSLPFGLSPSHKRALGVSDGEIRAARASRKPMLALRFETDSKCPPERWDRLGHEFQEQIQLYPPIPTGVPPWHIPKNAHAVLTQWYEPEPDDYPTRVAFLAVVAFFQRHL